MATFTTQSKTPLSWEAPAQVSVAENYHLNIGGGFNLLIAAGYKLIIQPGETETVWTPVTKNSPANY